jgi:hypothetical protein
VKEEVIFKSTFERLKKLEPEELSEIERKIIKALAKTGRKIPLQRVASKIILMVTAIGTILLVMAYIYFLFRKLIQEGLHFLIKKYY